MIIRPTALPEVIVIEPRLFGDARGFFVETWNSARYREAGIALDFVQDNLSRSRKGTLRGLHFQEPDSQGKLVSVLSGAVFDVVVDIRHGSPRFGQWVGMELDAESRRQMWIPPGFAHGFCVLSETADFFYKCTALYNPQAEHTVRWDDPALAINWPVSSPVLSQRDATAPFLSAAKTLPRMTSA